MFPSALITPLIALGSGCVVISLSIFHYFRDRVDNYIHSKMEDLFSKETTTEFIDGIKDGKVTSSMLHDFSEQLFEIFKPQQWLRALWIYFPLSGAFFICAGLVGSFAESNTLINYSSFFILIIGSAFFIFGVIQLIKLGKKLI